MLLGILLVVIHYLSSLLCHITIAAYLYKTATHGSKPIHKIFFTKQSPDFAHHGHPAFRADSGRWYFSNGVLIAEGRANLTYWPHTLAMHTRWAIWRCTIGYISVPTHNDQPIMLTAGIFLGQKNDSSPCLKVGFSPEGAILMLDSLGSPVAGKRYHVFPFQPRLPGQVTQIEIKLHKDRFALRLHISAYDPFENTLLDEVHYKLPLTLADGYWGIFTTLPNSKHWFQSLELEADTLDPAHHTSLAGTMQLQPPTSPVSDSITVTLHPLAYTWRPDDFTIKCTNSSASHLPMRFWHYQASSRSITIARKYLQTCKIWQIEHPADSGYHFRLIL